MDRQTPGWLKWTMALTLLNSWVLFEEVVVDRTNLWRHMPYYLVGRFCPWDTTVFALVAVGLAWSLRRIRHVRA